MLLAGVDVHAELEVLGDLDVQVGAEVELVVVGRALVVDTVLVLAVELYEVCSPLGTAVDADSVLVLCGDGLDDFGEPVGVRVGDGVVLVDVVLYLRVAVHRSGAGDREAVVVRRRVEHGVGQLDEAGRALETEVIVEGDGRGLVVFASLGGHEDDTVCRTSTVDGCGRILEDGHALDLVTGEAGEFVATAGDSVDDDERAVVAEGASAADEHGGVVLPGLTRAVVHDHAGESAGKTLGKVDGRVLHEGSTRCGGDGAGERELALAAVTDDDGFLEEFGVGFHGDVDYGKIAGVDFHLLVSDGAGDEDGSVGDSGNGVVAIEVRDGTLCGSTFHEDTGAHDGLAVGVPDHTLDSPGLGKRGGRREQDGQDKK